jgi:hypothetical protein
MAGSSGVGKPSSTPGEPGGVPELGALESAEGGGDDVRGLLDTKVRTLGELKAILIKHLGEKKGLKFYNEFMTSIAMMMQLQVQHAAERAKKAAQDMRMDVSQ